MFYTFIEKLEAVRYKSDNGLVFNSVEQTQKFKRGMQSSVEVAPAGTQSTLPGTFAVVRLIMQSDTI